MSIEQANTIDQLNTSLPRNVDLIREGDDHIRLLKSTIKKTFPKIKGAVNFSDERLNFLDIAVDSVDKEGNLVLSKSLTMKRGGSVNMNDARVQLVGKPVDLGDAVNLEYLKESNKTGQVAIQDLLYPVGRIVMFENDVDPNHVFKFGEWKKIGQGKHFIGAGEFTDLNADIGKFELGAIGGLYHHTLTTKNLPKFKLKVTGQTDAKGEHNHGTSWGEAGGSGARHGIYDKKLGIGIDRYRDYDNQEFATSKDGSHIHSVTAETEEIGENERFQLLSPFQVVAYWSRTK